MPRGGQNRKPLHERAWKSSTAAEYGCTVTFENEAGQTLVLHRVGPPSRALAALCDEALALDPTFRLVSYSTPDTILSDVRGRYTADQRSAAGRSQFTPEGGVLSRIGRLPLLHPRLRGIGMRESRYRAKFGSGTV